MVTEGAATVDTIESMGNTNCDAAERRHDPPSLLRATEDKVMKKRGVL